MNSRRRIGSRWLVGTAVAIASVLGLAGIAAAVVSSDGPPDYGVPKTVRDKAWCADRDAFRSAVEVDLPQLAAGQPVQAAAIAGFLAGHESLVFAYEENAVPEAGSGPPDQIAWLRAAADSTGLQDPGPFIEAETSVLTWAASAC